MNKGQGRKFSQLTATLLRWSIKVITEWVFWLHLPSSSCSLICFYEGTMVSFNSQLSLPVQLSLFLSFSPHLHHPRNADFQPQGLKSGWRGANNYGKENRREGVRKKIKRGEADVGRGLRGGAGLLLISRLNKKKVMGKSEAHFKDWMNTEVEKSVIPMLALLSDWD